MNIPKYIGNKAYCYSNSVSMMLTDLGEDISPSLVEVTSAVGLGAFWSDKSQLIFFSNLATTPDIGINNALGKLGFTFTEYVQDNPDNPSIEKLKKCLENSLVVIGPIDIDYLKTKGISNEPGGDHYIAVYKIEGDEVWIHDPQEYPALAIPTSEFAQIWKAENIAYRKGYYHHWSAPKRIKSDSSTEIYQNVLNLFKKVYQDSQTMQDSSEKVDEQAIRFCADLIKDGPKHLKSHLLGFCFPVGASRAVDYGHFFNNHNQTLATLKEKQAVVFSRCQIAGINNDWGKVSSLLYELADLEVKFRDALLVS